MKKLLTLLIISFVISLGVSYGYTTIYMSNGCSITAVPNTLGYSFVNSCSSSNIQTNPNTEMYISPGLTIPIREPERQLNATETYNFMMFKIMQEKNQITGYTDKGKFKITLLECMDFSQMNNPGCYCDDGDYRDISIKQCMSLSSTGNNNKNELLNAISWMYTNGLTSYSTVDKFMGNDYLTREQASKIFVKFANRFGNYDAAHKNNQFTDIKNADSTLIPYIGNAYSMGIINGKNNKFMPFDKLTQAQAIAIMIRVKNGLQDEKGAQWYSEYYTIAENYGMFSGLFFDFYGLDSTNIKRQEVALLLYRLANTKADSGTYIFPDGGKYIGEYKNDYPNGQGTYIYANGDKYVGKWIDGKKNGQGTLTYSDGDKYIGAFKNDMFYGRGTYSFSDGSKYIGNFIEGIRKGQGTMTFPAGGEYIKYVGLRSDDKPNGQGTMTYSDGSQKSGQWENGIYIGK